MTDYLIIIRQARNFCLAGISNLDFFILDFVNSTQKFSRKFLKSLSSLNWKSTSVG